MTDNIDKPQAGDGDKPQAGTTADSRTGQPQAGSTIDLPTALALIDELRRENAGHRKAKNAAEAATKAAEEKRLTEQQEWQKLAEARAADLAKLAPIAEQHEAITAAFNASLDNRLKQIPDDVRKKTVDPIRKALSPVDFSNWLDANLDLLRARSAPNLDGGAGGSGRPVNGTVDMTAQDVDMARVTGIAPEAWMKRKAEIERLKASPNRVDQLRLDADMAAKIAAQAAQDAKPK